MTQAGTERGITQHTVATSGIPVPGPYSRPRPVQHVRCATAMNMDTHVAGMCDQAWAHPLDCVLVDLCGPCSTRQCLMWNVRIEPLCSRNVAEHMVHQRADRLVISIHASHAGMMGLRSRCNREHDPSWSAMTSLQGGPTLVVHHSYTITYFRGLIEEALRIDLAVIFNKTRPCSTSTAYQLMYILL